MGLETLRSLRLEPMLTLLALTSSLLAAPPLKLAAVGLTSSGLEPAQARFYLEHFAGRLAQRDVIEVSTASDIEAALGLDRQKQLLGCADTSSSCLAEIAGALGVDGLITGQVARVGRSFQVNVKVLAAGTLKALFFHSSEVLKDEEALIGELNRAAVRAREVLLPGRAAGPAEVSAGAPLRGSRKAQVALWVGGGALAAGGAAMAAVAASLWSQLTTPSVELLAQGQRAAELRSTGELLQAIGYPMLGVGAAALVLGLVWFALDPEPPAQFSVVLGPDGAALTVRLRLP